MLVKTDQNGAIEPVSATPFIIDSNGKCEVLL